MKDEIGYSTIKRLHDDSKKSTRFSEIYDDPSWKYYVFFTEGIMYIGLISKPLPEVSSQTSFNIKVY